MIIIKTRHTLLITKEKADPPFRSYTISIYPTNPPSSHSFTFFLGLNKTGAPHENPKLKTPTILSQQPYPLSIYHNNTVPTPTYTLHHQEFRRGLRGQ